MASADLDEVRSAALSLPNPERAQLAHDLVQSLDAPADADAPDAREQEITRRISEIDAGTATFIDRDEFRRRMAARLSPG